MTELLPFTYKSKGHSEYGIYVELYLPKHAKLQGALYTTLTDGFKHEIVTEHFLNPEKRPKIIELLRHHKYEEWTNYTQEYVDTLDSLYRGYSMYEVDGVFKPEIGAHVDEERTQVIRFMFLPTKLDEMFAAMDVELGSEEHQNLLDSFGNFLRMAGHKQSREKAEGKERKLFDYIYEWYIAVGFFLFGYIVFEICLKIEALVSSGEATQEQEVWVSSFWHFTVNRIVFVGNKGEV